MHLKPKFAPLPPRQHTNFHHVLFDSPPGNQYPREHVLYIDGLTGEQQTHGEFYERVRDGATAMAAAKDDGGLGVRDGMVAIFAPNCIVRNPFSKSFNNLLTIFLGIQCCAPCMLSVDRSVRVTSIKANAHRTCLLVAQEQSDEVFRPPDSIEAGASCCERNRIRCTECYPVWTEHQGIREASSFRRPHQKCSCKETTATKRCSSAEGYLGIPRILKRDEWSSKG